MNEFSSGMQQRRTPRGRHRERETERAERGAERQRLRLRLPAVSDVSFASAFLPLPLPFCLKCLSVQNGKHTPRRYVSLCVCVWECALCACLCVSVLGPKCNSWAKRTRHVRRLETQLPQDTHRDTHTLNWFSGQQETLWFVTRASETERKESESECPLMKSRQKKSVQGTTQQGEGKKSRTHWA